MKIENLISLIIAGKDYCQQKTKKIVTNADNMISVFLLYYSKISQEYIASALGYDKTTVAKALNKLEQQGFVKRELNEKNRRENLINLTDQGKMYATSLANARSEWCEKISSCLTEKEEKIYDNITLKLLMKAKEMINVDDKIVDYVYNEINDKIVLTENAPIPKGHYCQAIKHNGLLYLSGILGIRPNGDIIKDGMVEEAKQVFYNLNEILKAGNSSIDKLLKVTVYISDMEKWGEVNELYGKVLAEHKCSRSIVPVNKLHYGLNIELDAIAIYE